MDRAASSLHGLLASQRVAGNNTSKVVQIFRQVVEQVEVLHTSANLLHFDLKPRNILVLEDKSVVLCDLDASMQMGAVRAADEKVS